VNRGKEMAGTLDQMATKYGELYRDAKTGGYDIGGIDAPKKRRETMKITIANTGALGIYGGKDAKLEINGDEIQYNLCYWLRKGDILNVNGREFRTTGTDNQSNHFVGYPVGAVIEL